MNLYRLESSPGNAISDFYGPILYRNAARARERALAESSAGTITVYRISGAGNVRAMYYARHGRIWRVTNAR